MVTDTIERELVLNAPVERVWDAITDAGQVSAWFGVQAEIDLRPGGGVVFVVQEGQFRARVVDVDPPRRFAYRWSLDKDTDVDVGPTTLVTFTLEPWNGGTRLLLVESGFASLPEKIRDGHLSQNTAGWAEELGELMKYLETGAARGS
jgi:uncharacterized protein YndB with AHSA1/START domain